MEHIPSAHIIGQAIVASIKERIEALDESLPWQRSVREADKARGQIHMHKKSIRLVKAVLNGMPASMEFFTFAVDEPIRTDYIKTRFDFDVEGRSLFLRKTFADSANYKSLRAMGLSVETIERCAEDGKTPIIKPGFPYDLTVDHTVDLAYGGTNVPENLCAIPEYVNSLKGIFTQVQYKLGRPNILSFRPRAQKDGTPVPVPVIPGGFQLLTNDGNTLKRRMETLLNADLK